MTAGSDIANGAASSLTDRSGAAASRITSARRVGSDSAEKVRSRAISENLTMWFSIGPPRALSTVIARNLVIPGPNEVRSPKSTATVCDYGFQACRFAAIRNDGPGFIGC